MKKWMALLLALLMLIGTLTACDKNHDDNQVADEKDETATSAHHNGEPSEPNSPFEKANRAAALQEARNKYTEAYAKDLSDGQLDGKEGDAPVADTNYAVVDGVATYTQTTGGYTVTFDGSVWTVDKE